jgi:hypothetical protein
LLALNPAIPAIWAAVSQSPLYGFTRFGRHARLDQLVLGRRDRRDESLDDRTECLILATLNDAPDERREIGHSIC